jgi:uncharacterized membrane protein
MTENSLQAKNDRPLSRTMLSQRRSQQRILTAPLPDPIAESIEAIITLHAQEMEDIPAHERVLENIAIFFGRPIFLYSLLIVILLWMLSNVINQAHILPFTLERFRWTEHGLDAAALLISTGVLIRQTRQESFAEQRAQLMLQLNLLSEQKIAKIIALLEELRTDLPDVPTRHDPEAEVMQEAANPIDVLTTLQENLARELSSERSTKSLKKQLSQKEEPDT